MRFIVLGCVFALAITAACAPSTGVKDEPAKAKAPGATEKAAAVAAKKAKSAQNGKSTTAQGAKAKQKAGAQAQKLVKPKATEPLGPELVINGSFEDYSEKGAPKGWNVAESVANSWNPVTPAKASTAASGSAALELQAKDPAHVVAASQAVQLNRLNLGRKYIFSAKMKAPANAAQATLKYKAGDRVVERRLIPKGTGEWETLSAPVTVQRYADPQSFRISIYRVPNQQGEVLIDDVSLMMQPGEVEKPAAAAPAPPAPTAAPAPGTAADEKPATDAPAEAAAPPASN